MSGTTLNGSAGGSVYGKFLNMIYGVPRQQSQSFFFSDGGAGMGAEGATPPGSSDSMGGSVATHNITYSPASAANNQPFGLRSDFSGQTCMPNGGNSPQVVLEFLWAPNSASANQRFFFGLGTMFGGGLTADPSSLTNIMGFAADEADTNLRFMHNDGSGVATEVDAGANFPKAGADNRCYYGRIVAISPTSVQYALYELTNNPTPFTGTVVTNLPAAQQSLGIALQGNTGAAGTTGGIKLGPFQLSLVWTAVA